MHAPPLLAYRYISLIALKKSVPEGRNFKNPVLMLVELWSKFDSMNLTKFQ
jgi:hypothetical protein